MTEQTNEQAAEAAKRSASLRQAYGKATARLRENHREEFDAFYAEEAKALGVDYKPRMTPAQKAEEEFQRLLAEFPELAQKVQTA